MIDVNELTLGQIKEIAGLCGATAAVKGADGAADRFPIPVGENVMVRTVTMILVGKLVAVGRYELALEGAAWVADTGRFSEMLSKGTVNEVEPFPDGTVFVGRGAIVDGCRWPHALLRVAK